jgi:two-component system, sensor histidine kinase YesM
MPLHKRSFFFRLLLAFFAGGLVPFIVLAVVFGTASARILDKAWRDRSREAIRGASELSSRLLADAAEDARSLAVSDPVRRYMDGDTKDAWLLSEINRLLSATVASSRFEVFLVPVDGSVPLSRSSVPEEYRADSYGGWGILGALSRSVSSFRGDAVFFGQPHPASGSSVPIAAGVPVLSDGKVTGYVVVDILRQAFSERVGSVAGAGGALTGLYLLDRSGCILYSMGDGQGEGTFADGSFADPSKFYVSSEQLPSGFSVTGLYPLGAVRSYSSRITAAATVIASLSMLVSFLMAVLLSRSLARPVHMLTLTMESVAQGRLDARCEELPPGRQGEEIALLIHRFNDMIEQVNGLVGNLVAQERELRRAETRALQAQINPHFLYNTLNSIRSMARLQGAAEIADMTTSLARIMREGSFPGNGFCTVRHSLDIARDYFAIEAARWPGRFALEESVESAVLQARIPRLIIQPIVENALVHGLEEKPGNGILSVSGRIAAGDVIITVRDDGAGISGERLAQVRTILEEAGARPVESSVNETDSARAGAGIALVNTHRRLSLIYGLPYGIDVSSGPGRGTTVTISFPFELGEDS